MKPEMKLVIDISREEAAHRSHGQAVKRVRNAERELEAAFAELHKAQESMEEIGVRLVVLFSRPMDAAWSAWKLQQFPEEGYSVRV